MKRLRRERYKTSIPALAVCGAISLLGTWAHAAPEEDEEVSTEDSSADEAKGADDSDDSSESEDDAPDAADAGDGEGSDEEGGEGEGDAPDASGEGDAPEGEGAAVSAGISTNAGADGESDAKKEEKSEDVPNPWVQEGEKEANKDKQPISNDLNHYKPGTGMTLSTADGRFKLATRLRAQMRYEYEHSQEEDDDGNVESMHQHVFGIRRARLQFKGNVFGKHNKFKSELAFSPRDLGMRNGVPTNTPLLTWYLEFDYLRDATIKLGQYKIPFNRQRVISSGNLMLVDRALAQGQFNLDRDIGIEVKSKDVAGLGGYIKYNAGIFMGEGRDKYAMSDFSMHYLARLEILPFGDFDDYSEVDFDRRRKPGLSLGVAASFIDEAVNNRGVLGSAPTDGGTTDYTNVTADVFFKMAGVTVQSEFFWRKGYRHIGDATVEDPNDPTMQIPADIEAARNGYGWFAQAGYLIPRVPVDIAVRYSQVRPIGDDDFTPSNDIDDIPDDATSSPHADELGGGVGWYMGRHPLKLQLDYFRHWDDGDMSLASDVVRLQLQLAF